MKIFFGSIFIKKEKLTEAGIEYPIKLEYYKIINEKEVLNNNKPQYGINIVKTEYKKESIEIEDKTIKYLSNDEKIVNNILDIFKRNEVTPITVEDVICDFSKKDLQNIIN